VVPTNRSALAGVALALALLGCGQSAAGEPDPGQAQQEAGGDVHQVAQRTQTRVGDIDVGLNRVVEEDGGLVALLTLSDASAGQPNFESLRGRAGDEFTVYERTLTIVDVQPGETGEGVVSFRLE
jgi:hypothetical protein